MLNLTLKSNISLDFNKILIFYINFSGKMGNNMAKENIYYKLEVLELVFGKMVKELNGLMMKRKNQKMIENFLIIIK